MINTVLFDMDGLLLDTEPLWGESMLRVAQRHNIPITDDRFKETTGLHIKEVTDYWSVKYPWQGSPSAHVAEEILDDIIDTAKQKGRVLPGVISTLDLLKNEGFKIGLASSSPIRMIDALIKHFGIYGYFDEISSADYVQLGKPHPAVFIHCANQLQANPMQCLVLEDSVNGMIAAKAARMKVIVVPDTYHYNDPRFALADGKLPSLDVFHLDIINKL
jgi:sugar-phosphatase